MVIIDQVGTVVGIYNMFYILFSLFFEETFCGMIVSLDCLLLQVPFLSVDGDIGIRTIQHCDTSPFSGEYVIEDVKGDGACYFRRLIFLSNRNVVQSEARLSSRVSHKGEMKAMGYCVLEWGCEET